MLFLAPLFLLSACDHGDDLQYSKPFGQLTITLPTDYTVSEERGVFGVKNSYKLPAGVYKPILESEKGTYYATGTTADNKVRNVEMIAAGLPEDFPGGIHVPKLTSEQYSVFVFQKKTLPAPFIGALVYLASPRSDNPTIVMKLPTDFPYKPQ